MNPGWPFNYQALPAIQPVLLVCYIPCMLLTYHSPQIVWKGISADGVCQPSKMAYLKSYRKHEININGHLNSKDLPIAQMVKICLQHRRSRVCLWVGKILWRREWQPTPGFLLDNRMDRGAWRATVHGVTKSQNDWATNTTATLNSAQLGECAQP